MLLAPSRTKYRRQHRGRMRGQATRGNTLSFGEYGLQAQEPCWMEARQIESARIALTRFMKRGGKVWIRVFPDKPISSKPAETRMGSGKGAVDHWVAVVKPGRIIFEIGGVTEEIAKEAVRLAGHKLPIKTRFITKGEAESVEA
ncbi:50S ribosomal protein L16 [Ktedonobacteria bacterium brp13]|jgi:large subunit ribosomal protein L16|nr:50S ribosomal protein L16 [Ktedonobacteria bacterium brp13]